MNNQKSDIILSYNKSGFPFNFYVHKKAKTALYGDVLLYNTSLQHFLKTVL